MTGKESTDLCALCASEMAERFRKRAASPVEVSAAVLKRIELLNPKLNAFNLVSEKAIADAKASEERWRRGEPKGMLDGVPVSIKDILLTKGWPTRRGSRTVDPKGPWDDDAPADAPPRWHGAVLLGQTPTAELGSQVVTA